MSEAPVTPEADEALEVEVICVGLMRTGLQSLHRALSTLGYTIYDQEFISHTYELWDDVLQNREPTRAFQTMFRGRQVVMGMPTFCFWEDILSLYPTAKVILTVRDEDAWWRSVSKARPSSHKHEEEMTGHEPFLN